MTVSLTIPKKILRVSFRSSNIMLIVYVWSILNLSLNNRDITIALNFSVFIAVFPFLTFVFQRSKYFPLDFFRILIYVYILQIEHTIFLNFREQNWRNKSFYNKKSSV
jgi:hypothetical protein